MNNISYVDRPKDELNSNCEKQAVVGRPENIWKHVVDASREIYVSK